MTDRPRALRTRWTQLVRPLQQRAAQANDWLMGRTPRERVLVFAGAFITLALIWQSGLFSAQISRLSELRSRQSAIQLEIDRFQTTNEALRQDIAELDDPDQPVREEIAALESDIRGLTEGDDRSGLNFIALMPIGEAIARLESVIGGENPVRIISFDRQMGEGLSASADDGGRDVAVNHRRLRLVFDAQYAQTTDLMARLETLDVPLVWRSLNYEVTDHPMARVTVRFDIYAPARLDQ